MPLGQGHIKKGKVMVNIGTLKNPRMVERKKIDYIGFEIWYVPEFPLADIDIGFTDAPSWKLRNEKSLDLLESDIQRQGLVNPLICRFRKTHGDIDRPTLLVGGARLFVLVRRLNRTHAPMLVCGEGGARYSGAIKYEWEDPALHALFKDGYLGMNTTGLCMARCSNRSKGEVPGDGKCSYREKVSEYLYVERPPGAPPVKDP
jgi:hypothetical protein